VPPQGPSPALFFDTISAYQRTEALRSAIELDLFSQVAAGRHTPAQLAEACQAAPRGIRILADYLAILGFLVKNGDRYDVAPDTKMFLDRASPAYVGGATGFMLAPAMRESFHQLPAAVRRGGTAVSDEGTVSPDNPIWVEFARAMAPLIRMPAQLLAGLVGGDPARPLRVLDVAAGHGLFGISIAERHPRAHITALDWANVLAVAAQNASRAGLKDRYALRPGSAFDVPWGGPYDIVLLTNFLHHFDAPTCEQLAARAFTALAPGGRALTLEFIPEPDRISPPSTATFALVMLATTARGDAYTFAELQAIFARGILAERVSPPPADHAASRRLLQGMKKPPAGHHNQQGAGYRASLFKGRPMKEQSLPRRSSATFRITRERFLSKSQSSTAAASASSTGVNTSSASPPQISTPRAPLRRSAPDSVHPRPAAPAGASDCPAPTGPGGQQRDIPPCFLGPLGCLSLTRCAVVRLRAKTASNPPQSANPLALSGPIPECPQARGMKRRCTPGQSEALRFQLRSNGIDHPAGAGGELPGQRVLVVVHDALDQVQHQQVGVGPGLEEPPHPAAILAAQVHFGDIPHQPAEQHRRHDGVR
jgi:hypothetical protein